MNPFIAFEGVFVDATLPAVHANGICTQLQVLFTDARLDEYDIFMIRDKKQDLFARIHMEMEQTYIIVWDEETFIVRDTQIPVEEYSRLCAEIIRMIEALQNIERSP